MNKKIISLLLSFVLLLSVACPVAFADSDTATHTHTWVDTAVSFDMEVCGISVKINVKKCDGCGWYLHTANVVGLQFSYPSVHSLRALDGELIDALTSFVVRALGSNANLKQYQTGGGSAGTGGVGRRPSGYVDDSGTPSLNVDGNLIFYAPITGWGVDSSYKSCGISYASNHPSLNDGQHVTGTFPLRSGYKGTEYFKAVAYFTAPVSGKYYLYNGDVVGLIKSPDFASYKAVVSWSSSGYVRLSQGAKWAAYCCSRFLDRKSSDSTYEAIGYGFHMMVVPDEVTVNKQTNITISQNVWNGNIYQDNSTNLTYIYPQYTTINENNETITNISNNPIIYNNETKQYYTYDTVTNNYYYITYEAPTPSPSPDPTPTPDPGTDPTPTPEPGGDTGDTTGILAVLVEIRDNMIQGFADIKAALVQGWADLSANFTLAIENLNLNITNIFNKKFPDQSTPETAKPSPSPSPSPSPEPSPSPSPDPGETPTPTPAPTDKPSGGNTNNFWNFVFPGGNDDGTENGHKGILWALISLLIAVVTFVLGLGSAYSYVFPFLPAGLVTTIHICVLVLLLFAIIKFVRSFL